MKYIAFYVFLIGALSAFMAAPAAAGDSQALFRDGNEAYKNGSYGKAIEKYAALVKDNGTESPELYYNLANAYFKDDKPGLALYYYEKAHRLAPRDRDITFNLDFARAHIAQSGDMSVNERFQWLGQICTVNELSITVSLIYFAFAAVLILYVFRKEERLLWLLCTLAFLLLSGATFLGMGIYKDACLKYGVVTAPSAELRVGPSHTESVSTIIPEGTKVKILRNDGDWVEISARGKLQRDDPAPHALQGWIPEKELKSL